jgi:hypothetical protein
LAVPVVSPPVGLGVLPVVAGIVSSELHAEMMRPAQRVAPSINVFISKWILPL